MTTRLLASCATQIGRCIYGRRRILCSLAMFRGSHRTSANFAADRRGGPYGLKQVISLRSTREGEWFSLFADKCHRVSASPPFRHRVPAAATSDGKDKDRGRPHRFKPLLKFSIEALYELLNDI